MSTSPRQGGKLWRLPGPRCRSCVRADLAVDAEVLIERDGRADQRRYTAHRSHDCALHGIRSCLCESTKEAMLTRGRNKPIKLVFAKTKARIAVAGDHVSYFSPSGRGSPSTPRRSWRGRPRPRSGRRPPGCRRAGRDESHRRRSRRRSHAACSTPWRG